MAVAETLERVRTPATDPSPSRPARWLAAAVVLLLAAVAAGLVVATALGPLGEAEDRDDRRADALQAARQHVVNLTSIDYRTLDRDLRRVLRGSTGDFREEFKAGTSDLRALLTESQAVSTGEVLEAGIVHDDRDSARVLVVADSTVRNTASEQPQERHYRIQLDLVRHGDRYLVTDLQFLG